MKVENLSLHHSELVTEALKKVRVRISEYSFANLYSFRDIHHYQLIKAEKLFIKGITRDQQLYYMPLFQPTRETLSLLREVVGEELLFPIPEEWLSLFDSDSYSISYEENDSDYLYRIEKLSQFSGRNLSKKRNLVKQFLATYLPSTEPLTHSNRCLANQVLNLWHAHQKSKEADYGACVEALNLFDKLNLNGKIYFIDGQPVAFFLGEWINEEVYVLHFEKALSQYKGLYQHMLQELCKDLRNREGLINLEQDLGLLTLRQTKYSYQPEQVAHKYRVKVTTCLHS